MTGFRFRFKPLALLGITILTLIFITAPAAEASIPDYFSELLEEVETEYFQIRAGEFEQLCTSYGLDPENATNRHKFLQVYFIHDLLTTVSAQDCVAGGFLQIPYFWHWIEPNPRHAIMSVPKGILLTKIKPPKAYNRYKTFADIGRVPALYLGDLITETPLYSHPDCGSFFSFGWCSEREMSYTAIMRAWKFPGKIVQEGIHTYSLVLGDFVKTDGTGVIVEARIDNTFDHLSWHDVVSPDQVARWKKEIGHGSHVDHYNSKASSPAQAKAINEKIVSQVAKARILKSVRSAIAAERSF